LGEKLGENIDVKFMRDNDPKFYNAWIQLMKTHKNNIKFFITYYFL
jgi:hypothetical protein